MAATPKLLEAVSNGDGGHRSQNEVGSNDSIWIDIGAPPADTGLGFVYKKLGSVDAAGDYAGVAPNEEAGSRLFVGNLTMRWDASNEPEGEVLVFSEEDAVSVPAVRKGAWIADVTYDEPSSAPPFGETITFTATVSTSGLYCPMETDYSGSHALYQDVIIV